MNELASQVWDDDAGGISPGDYHCLFREFRVDPGSACCAELLGGWSRDQHFQDCVVFQAQPHHFLEGRVDLGEQSANPV